MAVTSVPNRQTNEHTLDEWNQAFRGSPVYQNFMASRGLPTDGHVRLSNSQQEALERDLRAAGINLPSGMHIDQGGNLNQKNYLGRNIAIGAGIAGATLATMGAAGAFAGAGGLGGAAAGGGAGAAGAGSAGAGLGAAGIGTGAGLGSTALGGGAAALGGAGALAGTGIGTGAGLAGTLGGGAALGGAGALAGTGIGTGAGLAGTLGGGAAAAGGGGSFLSALGGAKAKAIGTGLNALGEGLTSERGKENLYGASQDRALADIYGTQQRGTNELLALGEKGIMDRAQLGINAPNARTSQLIRGSLLANVKPASFSGLPSRVSSRIPTLSGGLTPAALSPAARAGGAELQRQALLALLSGSDIPKMPDYSKALIKPPTLSPYRGAGGLETGAGIGGAILSGIGNYYGSRK